MKLILLVAIIGCRVMNSPVAIPVSANEGVIKIGSVATSGTVTLSGLEKSLAMNAGESGAGR